MAIAPLDELVTAFKVNVTTTQRLGVVESVDKASTSAWLAEVTIGLDPTPRPMRYIGEHQLQPGERVIWTDDGSSLPVVLGRASSSVVDQNYSGGRVDVATGSYNDAQGNLRTGITDVTVVAAAATTGLATTNTSLATTQTGLATANTNLTATNSVVNGHTTTLASYGSRISTLESWRTGTVTPALSSLQTQTNGHDTLLNNHASRLNTLDNWKAALDGPTGWRAFVENQLADIQAWKATMQGPSGWMAWVEARL